MSSALGPRIGVWGAFDVPDYGSLLVLRIFENELRRRLPHSRVFPYAPLEAEQLDLVVVAGDQVLGEGPGEELEQECPVVFSDVVPDTAILAPRLLSDETAQKRLRYLRAVDRYPAEGPPLVLETSTALGVATGTVTEARAHDPALPIVLVALGPAESDAELARALAADSEGTVHELTGDVTLDDLVVAIGNARGFCGASSAGFSTALGFGVPAVRSTTEIGALLREEIAADPEEVRELAERVDAHFDRLAAMAEESWSKRLGPAGAAELARALAEAERQHEALLRAYIARGERLLAEQERTAELLEALEADEDARTRVELAEARNRIEVLDAALAEARFERGEAQ